MLKRYIFCQKTLALKRGLDIGVSSQLKYDRAVVVVIAKGKLHGKGIGGIILVWRSEEDAAVLIITEIMIRIVEVRTYSPKMDKGTSIWYEYLAVRICDPVDFQCHRL